MKNKSLSTLCMLCLTILFITSNALVVLGAPQDDAEAKALGGAYAARARGAAGVLFNPAGLINDSMYSVRGSIYWRSNDLTIGSANSNDDAVLNGSGAFALNLSDNFAFGVGFSPIFENSLDTEPIASFSNSAFDTDFTFNMIRVAAAYKLDDRFYIGLGIDYYDASFTFNNNFGWTTQNIAAAASFDMSQSLNELSDNNIGFSIGFLGRLNDDWSVGGMYRHEAELEMTGDAAFNSEVYSITGSFQINEPALGGWVDPRGALQQQLPFSGNATFTLTLPSEFAFGVYFDGSETFSASADVRWTQWSSMADNKVVLNNGFEYSLGESWDDTVSLHLGADYKLTDKIKILAGYALAPSPIDESSVPQFYPYGDRNDFSFGSRFHFDTENSETHEIVGTFSFDFTFIFSQFSDLDSPDMTANYPLLELPFSSVLPAYGSTTISNEALTFLFGITAEFN